MGNTELRTAMDQAPGLEALWRALELDRALALLVLNAQGEVTWASRGFLELLRLPPGRHPDLDTWPELGRIRAALEGRSRVERLTLHRQGSERFEVELVACDLAEHGLAGARLLRLTELPPRPAPGAEILRWTTTPSGALESFNAAFHAYPRLTPNDAAAVWVMAIHPDDLDRTLTAWRRALHAGTQYRARFRLRRGDDGVYRWHQAEAEPLMGAEGRIVRWCGSCAELAAEPDPEPGG